jgi:hypothetical protein
VTWIIRNIRWIMVLSGMLTSTMIYALLAPGAALQSTFGETLDGALAGIIVRNWGALVAIVGALLIYGAFDRPTRSLALVVAGVSKAVFIALVLSEGGRFLGRQAATAVAVDLVMIALFTWYLAAARVAARHAASTPGGRNGLPSGTGWVSARRSI